MKTSERDLKRAFRDYVQSSSCTRKKDCPSPEEIWGLFAGQGSARRKAKLVDHITSCSFCFQEFDAFLEMSRAQGRLIYDVQSRFVERPRTAPFPLVWRYVTALLAFIVILAAALLTTKWSGLLERAEERGRLSGQIRLLAPSQRPAPRLPLFFKWEAIPGAEYYVIEIFDDSLLPFWKSPQLTGVGYELPMSVKGKLEKGKTYFWMLTAFSRDGAKAESSLEEFRLSE